MTTTNTDQKSGRVADIAGSLGRVVKSPVGTAEFVAARVAAKMPQRLADRVWGTVLRRSLASGRWQLVPDEQLREMYRRAVAELGFDGESSESTSSTSKKASEAVYVEFGVFAGASFGLMAETAQANDVDLRMVGFDSFRGLPGSVRGDEGGWKPGSFYCPEWVTRWNLETNHGLESDKFHLVAGWFDEVLTPALDQELELAPIDIAMLDADAYSSTVPVLEWLTTRLANKSIVIFDDWFWGSENGEPSGVERAFTEWSAEHPNFSAEPFGTYTLADPEHPEGARLAGHAFIITRGE